MTKRMSTARRLELIKKLRAIKGRSNTKWATDLPEIRPTTSGLTQAQPVRKRK